MRSFVVALVLGAVSCSRPVFAWEPHSYDSEARDSVSTHAYQEIADLNPSGALLQTGAMRDCAATYKYEPTFRPTEEWCLARVERRWLIRSTGSPKSNDTGVINPNAKQAEREIGEEVASLVHEIWLNAILEARYSRILVLGADGETHEFGARRYLSAFLLRAEVWSPSHDNPPLWLAEAGRMIFIFAQTDSADPARLQRDLIALRSKLFDFYRTRKRD
jgi:hypothetical protein